MKSFKLDQYGDVVITENKIEMVEGVELVTQTLRQVLNTNLGEWFGDSEEGIDYHVILTKNPNYELIKDTINTAVQKVADDLGVTLTVDNYTFETEGRSLNVSFMLAYNEEQTEVNVTL